MSGNSVETVPSAGGGGSDFGCRPGPVGSVYDVGALARHGRLRDWFAGRRGSTLRLLDVGCGPGSFLRDLCRKFGLKPIGTWRQERKILYRNIALICRPVSVPRQDGA